MDQPELTRRCKSCKIHLPLLNFTPTNLKLKYYASKCRDCVSIYNAKWYVKNKERALDYMKRYRKEAKDATFEAYGGYKCNCCGETTEMFLDIDHVNNDGTAHRKANKLTAGNQIYVWLRNHNYPDGFQVLCCNCNRGKFRNGGICPHKEQHA